MSESRPKATEEMSTGIDQICKAPAGPLGVQSRLASPAAHFLPRLPRGVPCHQPQLIHTHMRWSTSLLQRRTLPVSPARSPSEG
ncbi:hypothetical protein CKAH01_07003 [Colletotrichum kahawae]|uniref:Uncharacterized protein n=1 Tax=Colletotrichum kahawae TaxID=34407 RepID=A0AAD9Y7W0_COLKA|nr:hypothetical protein CKAH01_07003 [Colletotrichum kahawae]